ncbi:MAG: hypothetical protein WBM11_00475 [Terriglobales bacterium]
MRGAIYTVVLIAGALAGGQTLPTFELPGTLQLRDAPAESTPIERLGPVRVRSLEHLNVVDAQLDRNGRFVLKNVVSGRYSLILPFPGRIQSFTSGIRDLVPDGFDLSVSDALPLRIVVSLKTAVLSVEARGLPNEPRDLVVLLAPADPYLTLQESCFSNRLTEQQTKFRFLTPGKYRIFVVNSGLEGDVAAYAPRFPAFLKDNATAVEVLAEGETTARATYLDSDTVKAAILRVGPLR